MNEVTRILSAIEQGLDGLQMEAAEDLLALDEALEQLAREEATVAHLVKLRYFAGFQRLSE